MISKYLALNRWNLLAIMMLATQLWACHSSHPKQQVFAELPAKIDFNEHVRPILSDRCFACHGPDKNKREAGLRLDIEASAKDSLLESGAYAIVAGNLKKSALYQRITDADSDEQMPPPESNLSLSPAEIAILSQWIKEGAEYKTHWSLIPPLAFKLPKIQYLSWPKNNIDHYVLAKLEAKGLSPQAEADKESLARRLSFDLTALPPDIEMLDGFIKDTSAEAYERWVDQLLASPAAAERLTNEWLDVARYADTHGYTVDRYRPAWRWRDWVIKAFRDNMPYDQFVAWQLAGDLVKTPSRDQMIATGFNRNHAQNMEGGIVSEEFRVEYVIDRTTTFGTAFLGMTLQCTRCHDHKYDPISQKEFYQLFSFFNNVDEAGQISWDNALPVPTLLLTADESQAQIDFLAKQIAHSEEKITRYQQSKAQEIQNWLGTHTPPRKISPLQMKALQAYFPLEQPSNRYIRNAKSPAQSGKIIDPVTKAIAEDPPQVISGKIGKGLVLNGDDALYFPEVGIFQRADPFSIGLWVNIPQKLESGVIFHKNEGGIIYNFRGYQLSIEDNHLDIRLAHTFPYNAIHLLSEREIPKESWTHLMLTYDGSSKAQGVRLYVNGQLWEYETLRDHLYKDLVFHRKKGEPGLKIGARWRSRGIKGAQIDEVVVFDRALSIAEVQMLADSESSIEVEAWQKYYLANKDPHYDELLKELQTHRQEQNERIESVEEIMVMKEMDKARPTFVLERGVYHAVAEQVYPATPVRMGALASNLPSNRLGLAQWLMDPQHPLFARVTVNRYWQMIWGRGLVYTVEDFGSQGTLPTHPKLLDALAIRFVQSGWDVRQLIKEMVMSATYRQASTTDQDLLRMDPDNEWLCRGNTQRLSAEMLRDQALKASGLLVDSLGGPSVKPYQPEGLWQVNTGRYEADTGANSYRRSMYTFWKRSIPPPNMNIFDAPSRSYCVVRREKTSTPLQSLALMNDPQFLEASRVIAARVMQEGGTNSQERITYAFRLLSGRFPTKQELALLQNMYRQKLDYYGQYPQKALDLLAIGDFPQASQLNEQEQAAYMVLASTMMNTDASLYKR